MSPTITIETLSGAEAPDASAKDAIKETIRLIPFISSHSKLINIYAELLDYLDASLRDDQILFVNLHHRLSDVIDYEKFTHIKKFPPLVDSYALMAVSDALITDYSSVFFDYLTLGKQLILHVEDIEHYVRARGTYLDMLTLPFDMAYSKED